MRVPLLVVGVLPFAVVACSGRDDTASIDPAAVTTTSNPAAVITATSDPETTQVESTPPTTVEEPQAPVGFVFGEDDLCEWISPERASKMVASHYGWNGTATLNDDSRTPTQCHWHITTKPARDVVTLSIEEASWAGVLDPRTDEPTKSYRGPVDWEDLHEDGVPQGTMILGHPQLTDGVGIIYGGFGWHAVGVPEHGQFVEVHLYPDDFTAPNDEAWFALVNDVIAELGWTS